MSLEPVQRRTGRRPFAVSRPTATRTVAALVAAAMLLGACGGSGAGQDDFEEIPGIGATRVDVPRPTTQDGRSCTVALRPGESVAQRAAALRRIGLFADRAPLSDAALGAEIEAAITEAWGDQTPDEPLLELFVAEQDSARVWWRDLEADVGPDNGVYTSTLEEWAAISAGTFTPSAIEETWQSDAGPVKVAFDLGGTAHVLEPEYLEDWIDPRIATPINELIAPSGRQLAFFKAFDQTAFVMALTKDERDALEDRGWCFE
jgi:hypothetical protein